MSDSLLEDCAQRELKYQLRRRVSKEIRDRCPEGDPMVTGITVMLGSILAMAVFSKLFKGNARGRTR